MSILCDSTVKVREIGVFMSQKHFHSHKKSRNRQKLKLIPAGVRKMYQTLFCRKNN